MGGSSQSQASQPVFRAFPNAWGEGGDIASGQGGGGRTGFGSRWGGPTAEQAAAQAAATAAGYTRSGAFADQLAGMVGAGTAYDTALQNAILNPSYAPTSAADQSILNSLMDVTAGRGAVRGLGTPTQTSLAQAVAPQLVQNRQMQIQDLLGGQGLALQGKTIDMGALSELIGYAMPQIAGGTQSQGSGKGIKIL